ncbi:hypothetical protein PS655_04258 [Pseudomonas fluorescens]|uniref:Uncharacterized protein n=2 Tax=Pseudomonas fluorescens TaxID=294 RepID=A0A5E6VLS8_PSEFL|nr:hypothetical protein PS655_04258 [Pseudomonas fluorescens]
MAPRTSTRGSTSVQVHTRPHPTQDVTVPRVETGPRFDSGIPGSGRQGSAARPDGDADLDAIRPVPTVRIETVLANTQDVQPAQHSIKHYRIAAAAQLPAADAQGFRTHKGRRYVDMVDGGTVLVGLDAGTSQYRARLPSERAPSGPLLQREADSGLWRPSSASDSASASLSEASLQAFRTDLDFSAVQPDSDGVYRHNGRRYALIHHHAFQVMLDVDASSPGQPVWRIVNPQDPVAVDSENLYRASRSGLTHAVTRNENNEWVTASPGLLGGMRRGQESTAADLPMLLQQYVPIQNAHAAMTESGQRYDVLWSEARALPAGSPAQAERLIALEVHMLRHIRKQTEFVQSLVDNRTWLVRLKTSARFKEELQTFRIERVEYLNRLMAVMDLRTRPTELNLSAETCRRCIANLHKKLKFLEERQIVIEQIRKANPGTAPRLAELSAQVPNAERINFNKLTLYVHLYAGTPDHSPHTTMPSLSSIDLLTGDLASVPEREHPMALVLTLEQIKSDRIRFEAQLEAGHPKAEYIREIIALINPLENRIENRLTELFDSFDRNTVLPRLDQDIDFDFIPPQPVDSAPATPARTRKVFRTRQHGTYRLLVGDTETAQDGSVTIYVPDPLRPDSQPLRYEKRQGEWLPVRQPIARTARPQLIDEAKRLLNGVDEHIAQARAHEARQYNPTDIIEGLGRAADQLSDQARRLEYHEASATDSEIIALVTRLRTAAESLTAQGQQVLVRMYKNKDVLDILRLNYLIDHGELNALKTVDRKPLGKGAGKSFLDVYSIRDRADDAPLWEAHFHYDKADRQSLNFTAEGSHLKTLEQSRRGLESQRRDEQAGLPHVRIWRQTFDGRTASKIFTLADNVAGASR